MRAVEPARDERREEGAQRLELAAPAPGRTMAAMGKTGDAPRCFEPSHALRCPESERAVLEKNRAIEKRSGTKWRCCALSRWH